jgi:hypothetical protein
VRDALVAGLSGTAAQVEPLDGCAEPRLSPPGRRQTPRLAGTTSRRFA